jgi:hypothetical protein
MGSTRKSGGTTSAGNHYHEMEDGVTSSANHLPPYLEMLFASIDSDGFGEADSIVMFSALPPLGWTRYSDLDDTFPRGASTAGGIPPRTGGTIAGKATSESHSVTSPFPIPPSTPASPGVVFLCLGK